jgi:steroid delta-isomerase-like uncharacterized protein
VLFLAIVAGCGSQETTMDDQQLQDLAHRYAAAWSGGDPAAFGAFYAPDATFRINDGETAEGREAIVAVAGSFMESFPDMVVALERVVRTEAGAEFHWRWTGTNTGPGGNGRAVDLLGHEEWTFSSDGLIQSMQGHLDQAAYDRQLGIGEE